MIGFRNAVLARCIEVAGPAAMIAAALICGGVEARADAFADPKVFTSSGGVLDLLMVAKPQPVPSILFPPWNNGNGGGNPINPVGWVYEICPRQASDNACPAGGSTVAEYGGVRFALQQGDTLKIRLVNQLPLLDPLKAKHTADPGGANLFLNPTNLHTHGLIVPPRTPTLSDPTFGDYVFVEVYNSANGMPSPQAAHQHGSVKMDYIDYRIDIPANHPSGSFWFHPHVHGLSLNQVSGGMAGIITIGSPSDYVANPPSVVRHLILKDMQVLAARDYEVDGGTATFAEGEVQYQESPAFCSQQGGSAAPQRPGAPSVPIPREGYCTGEAPEFSDGNDYTGGRWYFTVNGQVFPTINLTSPDGEIWRLTNTSAQISYRLNLVNDTSQAPMLMQLIAIDGVAISVPPGTPTGTVMKMGGNKFTTANCPTTNSDLLPVCVTDLFMMPSSRAEVFVTYRDANGSAVLPPSGASATLIQEIINLGPAGESWPIVEFLKVQFNQTASGRQTVDVVGNAREALSPRGIFGTRIAAKAAPAGRPAANCLPLAAGHRRRIFFGFVDPTDPDSLFGLGYEEVDENNVPVAGTLSPVSAYDPAVTTVCVPLGAGGAPVHETWELISLATELHNFHMHQTKFQVIEETVLDSGRMAAADAPVLLEDNVPIPFSFANDDIRDNQNGYCTIEQWRSGVCTARKVVVDIPFSQLGDTVYHCHILEHEDGGMMAKIRVVPEAFKVAAASTHDFDGDGKSDILWRDSAGHAQMWLMDGGVLNANFSLGLVPTNWSVAAQRDFDGDGKSDILWRNTSGDVAIWLMNGTGATSIALVGNLPTRWSVVGTADFDGDGRGDILWRDSAGNLAIWFMNGATVSSVVPLGNVPTIWSVAGTADFNGDGKSDVLWRDVSGNTAIWLMNGGTVSSVASIGTVPGNWSVVGTGDFNGDSNGDIFWRDSSGNVAIWLMNGTTVDSTIGLGNVPSNWSVSQTGDYNGESRSDILWRATSGDIAMWLMSRGQISSVISVGSIPANWTIQGANAD